MGMGKYQDYHGGKMIGQTGIQTFRYSGQVGDKVYLYVVLG